MEYRESTGTANVYVLHTYQIQNVPKFLMCCVPKVCTYELAFIWLNHWDVNVCNVLTCIQMFISQMHITLWEHNCSSWRWATIFVIKCNMFNMQVSFMSPIMWYLARACGLQVVHAWVSVMAELWGFLCSELWWYMLINLICCGLSVVKYIWILGYRVEAVWLN